MPALIEDIADFIVNTKLSDLPPGAGERSKKVIADTYGVAIGGARSELAGPLRRYLEGAGCAGDCPVLGTGLKLSQEMSAFANGCLAAALDLDDVVAMMPGHPSAIVVGVAIAEAARRPITGEALIEAHILGVEVGSKLGPGITKGHYDRGFHGTGTLGLFSAVATLAKLRRFDARLTQATLGIACSMASGVRRNFGTMTKPMHSGWAARCAVAAADMAQSGFTASVDALDGEAGFFDAYGVAASRPGSVAATLGRPWVIVEPGISLRKFACYNALQRSMFAVLAVREKLGLTADTLQHLECRMPPGGMQGAIYPEPKTWLEGKFSLQYVLAAGILDGRFSLWTFSDEAVGRPAIKALLARIDGHEDARCADADPQAEGGHLPGGKGVVEVRATTVSGATGTCRITIHPGHPSRELSWPDLEQKFLDCAAFGGLAPVASAQVFGLLQGLEQCRDIGEITRLASF